MPTTVLLVSSDRAERSEYTTALAATTDRVYAAATFVEARSALLEAHPDVLVAQVRLGEFNGVHLALWGRGRLPHLRCVIIGQSDPNLEAEVRALGLTFLRSNDVQTVLQATLEALAREKPRRRWVRKPLATSLVAHIDGSPALVLDVSYGGFRVQTHAPFRAEPDKRFALDIPAVGVCMDATCRWVAARGASGPYWCGATVNNLDLNVRAGSPWRVLVDAMSPAS